MPSLRTLPQDLRLFAKYHLVRRSVDYPARENELSVVPLGFDLDEYVDALHHRHGHEHDGDFEVTTLDTVVYQGREHPILRIRSRNFDAKKTLLVLAGVHGNEHAGLLAVPDILAGFDDKGPVRLVVVTPVNPVGAAELSRYNGDGYDINRDFERFDTKEARAVAKVYAEEEPDFVVSLHEGPQDATFMFANRFVDPALAERLLDAMKRGGTELATRDYFGMTLRPPGLSAMGKAAWLVNVVWAKTLGMKATLMYSDDRHIPELVLESSWRLPDREARVRGHVDLVHALLVELPKPP
jgi:hypothetical protein